MLLSSTEIESIVTCQHAAVENVLKRIFDKVINSIIKIYLFTHTDKFYQISKVIYPVILLERKKKKNPHKKEYEKLLNTMRSMCSINKKYLIEITSLNK